MVWASGWLIHKNSKTLVVTSAALLVNISVQIVQHIRAERKKKEKDVADLANCMSPQP